MNLLKNIALSLRSDNELHLNEFGQLSIHTDYYPGNDANIRLLCSFYDEKQHKKYDFYKGSEGVSESVFATMPDRQGNPTNYLRRIGSEGKVFAKYLDFYSSLPEDVKDASGLEDFSHVIKSDKKIGVQIH